MSFKEKPQKLPRKENIKKTKGRTVEVRMTTHFQLKKNERKKKMTSTL